MSDVTEISKGNKMVVRFTSRYCIHTVSTLRLLTCYSSVSVITCVSAFLHRFYIAFLHHIFARSNISFALWFIDHNSCSLCPFHKRAFLSEWLLVYVQLYFATIVFRCIWVALRFHIAVLGSSFKDRIVEHYRLFQKWALLRWEVSFDNYILIYDSIPGLLIIV